jgi:hypothetical protein
VASERCNFTRRFLEKLISEGKGPATIKFGARRIGVIEADLNAWMRLHRRPAPSEATAPSTETV